MGRSIKQNKYTIPQKQKMKFLATYKSNLVLATSKGEEAMNTLKTYIHADSIEEANQKCRNSYGEPLSMVKYN
jgi:hypothetical protein